MYVKVEPTGCCERKGLVQVRFCMYLEDGDYGYSIHRVQVPVRPKEGYPGPVDALGVPEDPDAYILWLESLPKIWRTNPFHNHFIRVEPEISDEEIMNIGVAFLEEAYTKWACDQERDLKNPAVEFPSSFSIADIEAKLEHLKTANLERKV